MVLATEYQHYNDNMTNKNQQAAIHENTVYAFLFIVRRNRRC